MIHFLKKRCVKTTNKRTVLFEFEMEINFPSQILTMIMGSITKKYAVQQSDIFVCEIVLTDSTPWKKHQTELDVRNPLIVDDVVWKYNSTVITDLNIQCFQPKGFGSIRSYKPKVMLGDTVYISILLTCALHLSQTTNFKGEPWDNWKDRQTDIPNIMWHGFYFHKTCTSFG